MAAYVMPPIAASISKRINAVFHAETFFPDDIL